MDKVATIIKMQEKNLSNLEKNRTLLEKETSKFDETQKVYNQILKNDAIDKRTKQKYYLEYSFLFEQYNQKKLPLDNYIKRSEMYSKRLEQVLDYIELSNNENHSFSALRSKLYQINSAVINEAVCYYEGLVEKYKQDKIMNSKFLEYINYLKQTNDDYEKYKDLIPKNEEIEEMVLNVKRAEYEKDILIDVFRSDRFVTPDDVMSLVSADIPKVVDIMYPGFKEKLSEIDTEKGKQAA